MLGDADNDVNAGDGHADDEHSKPPDDGPDDGLHLDGFGALLREYYEEAFKGLNGSLYLVKSNEDGETHHRAFLFVSFKTRLKFVRTRRQQPQFVCRTEISWFENWRTYDIEGAQPCFEVSELQDAEVIYLHDFVKIADDRYRIYNWEERPSWRVDTCWFDQTCWRCTPSWIRKHPCVVFE